jgi:Holliday junction resolvase RusA-like endonuclease
VNYFLPPKLYVLEFTLVGLPRMANLGNRSHWRHAHAEAKRWQAAVTLATIGKRPATPLDRYRLTLTRYSSVQPDFDGLVRGFKSVVDGLRVAKVISDDKLDNSGAWDCRWVKCKKGEGKVVVRVEAPLQENASTALNAAEANEIEIFEGAPV